jgi:hypothetical protein
MPTKIPVAKYLKADLFEELGLTTIAADERASFLEGFGNVLQYRLTFRLMDELSEEQKEKLDQTLGKDPQSGLAVMDFLSAELPKFEKIVEEEVAKYKKELIDRFKA